MNWRVRPLGALDALKRENVEKALDFVQTRKADILKVLLAGWGLFLLMTFSLIATVRLALSV